MLTRIVTTLAGDTIADRISKGPIPLDEALPIAKQIAEALEAAHEAGVIHRDLKPANIKVREDGTVKVLDFGLAKALDPDPASAAAANSPTISLTAVATQMGMVIGTAAYMSPEQARGQAVDRRADVWAFAAVLFEMLSGRRVFDGRDVSETLAAVIKSEAPWEALPSDTPATVNTVLRRCLEKEPKHRIRDIGDVQLAMEALRRGYAAASTDTGHTGTGGDASFALGHPEKLTDFGYRAVHEMTVTAKAAVLAVYGDRPRFSYWQGCSTGGKQGLAEAQRFPDDYDMASSRALTASGAVSIWE